MNREDELFQELIAARKRLNIARVLEQEARTELSVRKTDRLNAEGTIEEILSKMEIGKRGRPMLDAIAARSEETANRQVGGPFQWSTEDLDRCLEEACHSVHDSWPKLAETGCEDAQILDVLRAIWPAQVTYWPRGWGRPAFAVQGGTAPKFWIDTPKSDDQPPTLAGLDLVLQVRQVLGLPLTVRATEQTTEKTTKRKGVAK